MGKSIYGKRASLHKQIYILSKSDERVPKNFLEFTGSKVYPGRFQQAIESLFHVSNVTPDDFRADAKFFVESAPLKSNI